MLPPSRLPRVGGKECHVQDFPASQEDPKFHVVSARPGCSPALRYCWPSLPLTYEHMADDVAALLRHRSIEQADVFGFSMGGAALQVAIRHPEVVRKLVVASASYTSDGMHPELLEITPTITPEAFAGSPIEEAYLRTAPNPDDFPNLVTKVKRLDMEPFAWPPEDIRGIEAPTLLIIGDSDAIRLEHAIDMFRLLGGGVMGDLAGFPKSQLAVLPGTASWDFVPRAVGSWTAPIGWLR
jgi:pimeloyl-ACP methyl ester carboxylesterase